MKLVVRLAALGIAAMTAQAAVMTPAHDAFASIAAQFTPQPATLGLIGIGLTALGLLRRRSRKQ